MNDKGKKQFSDSVNMGVGWVQTVVVGGLILLGIVLIWAFGFLHALLLVSIVAVIAFFVGLIVALVKGKPSEMISGLLMFLSGSIFVFTFLDWFVNERWDFGDKCWLVLGVIAAVMAVFNLMDTKSAAKARQKAAQKR